MRVRRSRPQPENQVLVNSCVKWLHVMLYGEMNMHFAEQKVLCLVIGELAVVSLTIKGTSLPLNGS